MTALSFQANRRETLALGAAASLASLVGADSARAAPTTANAEGRLQVGRDQPFNDGWRFLKGADDGNEAAALDDAGWRVIDLPHDFSIEGIVGNPTGPFIKTALGNTATGFAVGGEGWYRKHFRLDGLPADARIEVLFDGVCVESDAWLNGRKLGSNVNGYNPFAFDLTPHLSRKGDNVLAVRVRNEGRNSRWYSGSGISREVRIDVLPAGPRIARWGVGAWTRRIENGVAEIDVSTKMDSGDPSLQLVTRLRDASGKVVGQAASSAVDGVKQTLVVRAPRLWSPASPALYVLEAELRRGDAVVDRMIQPFGIRIVTMDPARGLQINGQHMILRGGCIHHDNGLLGACAYPDADERRIRALQARGYNAIRSAHNIASRSLREACDRLGMLLMNEAFDTWHAQKLPQDFSTKFRDHWREVIDAMVFSARNSPSVILWSIGNEIPQRATPEGIEWEWKLANAIKAIDPTRPVTAGLNGVLGAPMVAQEGTARAGYAGKREQASSIFLDVNGYNYRLADIEEENAEYPQRLIVATETFPKDAWDYARLAERMPNFMGEFLWTAMDYLGEAGIGASSTGSAGGVSLAMVGWPWINAYCGDIDLIGDQKAPSRYRDVVWGLSKLEIAVQRPTPAGKVEVMSSWGWSDELQSWNWQGQEGKAMNVRFYTQGDRVELLLNGTKIAEKALTAADKFRGELAVPYAPGVLEAIAYSGGSLLARKRLVTVGAAAKLRIRPERAQTGSRRIDLSYVAIDVLDAQGRRLPDEQRKLSLTIDGPAELVGFGSGNPQAVGSFQSSNAQSFKGKALAILRGRGTKGSVRVTAHSDGLPSASAVVQMS